MSTVLQAKLICDGGGEGCVGFIMVDAHVSYDTGLKLIPYTLPKGWRKITDGVHICGSDACEQALKRRVLG